MTGDGMWLVLMAQPCLSIEGCGSGSRQPSAQFKRYDMGRVAAAGEPHISPHEALIVLPRAAPVITLTVMSTAGWPWEWKPHAPRTNLPGDAGNYAHGCKVILQARWCFNGTVRR